METTYIVGVGRVSARAEQGRERREQLHGAGLLWTTRDPIWVGVWDHTPLDQLADTWEGAVYINVFFLFGKQNVSYMKLTFSKLII